MLTYNYWNGEPALLLSALALYGICLTLQSVLHESGHLAGGKLTGHCLLRLQLGPVIVRRNSLGRYRVSADGSVLAFQCVMVPGRITVGACVAYHAGGVIMNVLSCLCLGIWVWHTGQRQLLTDQWIYAGVQKFVLNILPYKRKHTASDGYHLLLLIRYPAMRKEYQQYLQRYAKSK